MRGRYRMWSRTACMQGGTANANYGFILLEAKYEPILSKASYPLSNSSYSQGLCRLTGGAK